MRITSLQIGSSRRRIVHQAIAESLECRRMLASFVVTTLTDEQTSNDVVSLREALQSAADNGAGGAKDVITFASSLFTGALPKTMTLALGELLVDSNVVVQGPGSSQLIVDAHDASRVINLDAANVDAAISGMTMIGGSALTGGGINNGGILDLSNCTIRDNQGLESGGGIYNSGQLLVTNVTFDDNHTTDEDGGALYNAEDGNAAVFRCTFIGNSADDGGAILNVNATLTATDCTFDDNVAAVGGAIASDGVNAVMTLMSCTFSNNRADFGGAMRTGDGTASIINCAIAGNTGHGSGGGAEVESGTTFTNCTISGNSADDGSGGGIFGNAALKNTIVAGNSAEHDGPDLSGDFTGSTFNVIGKLDFAAGISNGVDGNQGGTVAAPLDPQLGALALNGGPTQTMAIPITSPAFNSGNNSDIASITDKDQRGFVRIVGGTVDIGAYENQAGSGGAFAILNEDTLYVEGTEAGDVFAISVVGGNVRVSRNGIADEFVATSVTRIELRSGAGDDTITLGVGVPETFVDAGSGNDVVASDPARASKLSATGAGGDDILVGGAAADELSGANGKDRVLGSGGNDYLLGGAAKDYLFGGEGDDTCSGAGGKDRVFGDAGSDYLLGGTGNDLLDGAFLLLAGTDGIDTLSGNAGVDTGVANPNDLVAGIENLV